MCKLLTVHLYGEGKRVDLPTPWAVLSCFLTEVKGVVLTWGWGPPTSLHISPPFPSLPSLSWEAAFRVFEQPVFFYFTCLFQLVVTHLRGT